MLPQEEAIKKISLELSQIYRKRFGRDLSSELIKDKEGNIVKKFGLIIAAIEIFSQDEKISRARKRPVIEEES